MYSVQSFSEICEWQKNLVEAGWRGTCAAQNYCGSCGLAVLSLGCHSQGQWSTAPFYHWSWGQAPEHTEAFCAPILGAAASCISAQLQPCHLPALPSTALQVQTLSPWFSPAIQELCLALIGFTGPDPVPDPRTFWSVAEQETAQRGGCLRFYQTAVQGLMPGVLLRLEELWLLRIIYRSTPSTHLSFLWGRTWAHVCCPSYPCWCKFHPAHLAVWKPLWAMMAAVPAVVLQQAWDQVETFTQEYVLVLDTTCLQKVELVWSQ